MRRVPVALAMLALVAPLAAAGYGGGGNDGHDFCPPYDVEIANVQATSPDQRPWGALLVTIGDLYVVEDTAVVNSANEPWLLSIWFYGESGARPGLQRQDEVCDECADDRWACDYLVFF
ncbi:MAG TPA: hypothetical protein VM582_00280 [Candidatus Thermoplasmatota archaeon]|nr:hypothetical protein [Candidatus Thermoplasmatota archaeon]